MIPSVGDDGDVPEAVYQRGLVIDSQQKLEDVELDRGISKGIGD